MSEDVWSESDTNPDRIEAALRELLRERHAANPSLAPARVLNLVVIADREWKGEVANRLERVGRYNASRTVLCTVEEGRSKLDSRAVMSYQEPDNGIGVIHEQVEIDMGPSHLCRLETIVDPVLVPELPTMVWSPHGHDEGVDAIREAIDVMLLDSDDLDDAREGLFKAADALEWAYVVDLAWLRTTPWRERLASSFDTRLRRSRLGGLTNVTVRHQEGTTASALLLVGWLVSRLGWSPSALSQEGPGRLVGSASRGDEQVELKLEPAEQNVPGLAGVTVCCGSDFSLALDRGEGGLQACQQRAGEQERTWKILGASRGEGGILGEGVRQALLRDPTYGPALAAARELCPA